MGNKSKVDFDGKKYREVSELQQTLGKSVLEELNFKGDEKILDLGCGDGSLTARIADHVPQGVVIGIDASTGMIRAARELRKNNLQFKLMDIKNISFNNEFDIIFSNAALHWVHNHQELLKKCYQALKPGGQLRFNFAAKGNCRNLYSVVKKVIKRPEYAHYFEDFRWPWYMPSVNEYRDIINLFEYTDAKIWSQNADKYFETQDKFTGWIEQPCLVPFLKEIKNKNVQKDFRNLIVKK